MNIRALRGQITGSNLWTQGSNIGLSNPVAHVCSHGPVGNSSDSVLFCEWSILCTYHVSGNLKSQTENSMKLLLFSVIMIPLALCQNGLFPYGCIDILLIHNSPSGPPCAIYIQGHLLWQKNRVDDWGVDKVN